MAIVVASVANLMSEATAPRMGRPVTNAKVLIIFKLCVTLRLQPRRRRALTEARSHSHHRDTAQWGARVAMAKEVANVNTSRRRHPRNHQSRMHMKSISGPFSKGTSLAICYYLVLSGQHIVTSIIQFYWSTDPLRISEKYSRGWWLQ